MLKRTIITIDEAVLERLRLIKNSEKVSICETVRRAVGEHLARRDEHAKAAQKRRTER